MEKVIIVGGGVAGLSCLNALLDQGINALLIEAEAIGTPKMCGEFLAPPAVRWLEQWNVSPIQEIKNILFYTRNKKTQFSLSSAGACSRSEIELQLAKRAREKGGRIVEFSKIEKLIPASEKTPYVFHLVSGEKIESQVAIFATGRLMQSNHFFQDFSYVGFKMHFEHDFPSDTLFMHSLPGAYFGMVSISKTISNCTCLLTRDVFERYGSAESFLIANHLHFNAIKILEKKVPDFSVKQIPRWPNAFWIGDAVSSLYPAMGYGLAHAVESGIIAAEFYMKNNPQHYLKFLQKKLQSALWMSKRMHQILLNPLVGNYVLPLFQSMPWLLYPWMKKMGYDIWKQPSQR